MMHLKIMNRRFVLGLIYVVLGAGIGIAVLPILWHILQISNYYYLNNQLTNAIIGAIIFYILFLITAKSVLVNLKKMEIAITKKSPSYLLFGSLFSLIGLILASVISIPLYRLPNFALGQILPIIIMLIFGYFGFKIGTLRKDEWTPLFQNKRRNPDILERKADDFFHKYKLLDTSVIIDGRIKTIAKTGFIEGVLLVPHFVLHELQLISDSSDNLKRARGRRGLDILNELQKDTDINIEMYDGDYEDIAEVDTKLVKLAKALDGVVVTNDYNLNKVAEFQNVPVLNINELANTLKPAVLPGEQMHVTVVKAGTERQQGVAYLDDGTMIVVEDGQYYLNKPLDVVVTSALQTAAGRMIFAKPLHQQNKIKG